MNHYHRLQSAILEMNGANFQNLVLDILRETTDRIIQHGRPGSQVGKQSTRKGIPDGFLRLNDGRIIAVEATTQNRKDSETAFWKKQRASIESCLEKLPSEVELAWIELAVTAPHELKDHQIIEELKTEYDVDIRLHGLDHWVDLLATRCRFLVKDHFDFRVSSDQLLSVEQFLRWYEHPGFQPNLRNPFVGGTDEISRLTSVLEKSGFVVVTGRQGTGKTRLSLEAIYQRMEQDPATRCYCVVKSTDVTSLYNDLEAVLTDRRPYILLVDDANRQMDHLKTVLAFRRKHTQRNIRILATVRDYGTSDILNHLVEYRPRRFQSLPTNSETVEEILQTEPFGPLNRAARTYILNLAKGNTRTAILVANYLLENPDEPYHNNIISVYDDLFRQMANACPPLLEDNMLRALGVLSLFRYVDLKFTNHTAPLLRTCGLTIEDFRAQMEILRDLEFVEHSEDRTIFRFADQSLATYLFYRTALRDELLPFDQILKKYWKDLYKKLREAVISAHNDFGEELVRPRVEPMLLEIWGSVRNDFNDGLNLLRHFWAYLLEEGLAYVLRYINSLPEPPEPVFPSCDASNINAILSDEWLSVLGDYLRYGREEALELGFMYIERHPATLTEWLSILEDKLAFTPTDLQQGLERPNRIWTQLEKEWQAERSVYLAALPYLVRLYLRTRYTCPESSPNPNSVRLVRVNLSPTPAVLALRERVLSFLSGYFPRQPEYCFRALREFPYFHYRQNNHQIWKTDLPIWRTLVEQHFQPEQVYHCAHVHYVYRRAVPISESSDNWTTLLERFDAPNHQLYRWLHPRLYEWREYSDYREKWTEFRERKQAERRQHLLFSDMEAFQRFHNQYQSLRAALTLNDQQNLVHGVADVFYLNYQHNSTLTLSFLKWLIDLANPAQIFPGKVIHAVVQEEGSAANRLFTWIAAGDFQKKLAWMEWFIENAPVTALNETHYRAFLKQLRTETFHAFLPSYTRILKRLSAVVPTAHSEVFMLLRDRSTAGEVQVDMLGNFLAETLAHFPNTDLPDIAQFYLSEEVASRSRPFDLGSKAWYQIAERYPPFILQYIQHLLDRRRTAFVSRHDLRQLGACWQLEQAEEEIEKVLDLVLTDGEVPITTSFASTAQLFFTGIPSEFQERAEQFLLRYLNRHVHDAARVSLVFNLVCGCFPNRTFDAFFVAYLSRNPDLDLFNSIHWTAHGRGVRVYNGDIIIQEETIRELEHLVDLTKRVGGVEMIPIQQQLNECIIHERERANEERRRRFMRDY